MIALYVLGALLLLLLVGVMLAPLLEDARPAVALDELPPDERREAALDALRDVEFEHETGKLDDAEHRRLRTHFGRAVLEAEEAMTGTVDATAFCTACGSELRAGVRYCPACGEPRPGAEEPPAAEGSAAAGGPPAADGSPAADGREEREEDA